MREFAVLPPEAHEIVAAGQSKMRALLLKNIQAEKPKTDANTIADLITVFFSGLCIEQNLVTGRESGGRKVDALMQMIRAF